MRRALLALCLLAACTSPARRDADLAAALTAMHLLEARQSLIGDVTPALRDSALAAHGFTPSRFAAEVERLHDDLDRATRVYADVSAALDTLRPAATASPTVRGSGDTAGPDG